MEKSREEIIEYINNLKGYEGFVQFSDTAIRAVDIFREFQDITLSPTDGFIYEAHFCNEVQSIQTRQINDKWLVSDTQFSEIYDRKNDIKTYHSIAGKVKMAQIWEAKPDDLCEGMEVMKLQKVVFVGFEKENR